MKNKYLGYKMLANEKKSPFQSEAPVSPEKFEGREEIFDTILLL
jgi:hypothetical protein